MDSNRIERILDSGYKAVFVTTGGGSGALHSLLTTPGASRFVADAQIPYSPKALERLLGEKPEQSVSPITARKLAAQAFENSPPAEGCPKGGVGFPGIGIACTSALQTDRARRGDDRAFICIKTAEREKLYSLYFFEASRAEQETLLSDWLLVLIAQAVGAERGLMLPGSFNPIHCGHIGMLKAAEEITGLRGVFELSAVNVDKPDISEEEIIRRASSIRDIPVALTRAPRFTQKAKLFPNTTFVLGHDTAERLIEYAQDGEWDVHAPQRSCFHILGTSFLVAGRQLRCGTEKFQTLEIVGAGDDRAHRARLQNLQTLDNAAGAVPRRSRFQTLEKLVLPVGFESLFESIPESKFREDISSTALRNPSS